MRARERGRGRESESERESLCRCVSCWRRARSIAALLGRNYWKAYNNKAADSVITPLFHEFLK